MPVTLDPEHLRALWGGIVGLAFFLALALWHLRHAKRRLPEDRDRPAPSLLSRAAKASGFPPALAYPIFALALGLLVLGLAGAVTLVGATILQTLTQGAAAASLGAGALIAALLGAPFILWRSLVAQRTVNIAQESHVTDLIAKAVEQLGAEKTIDRIGRPVTVWTGERTELVHDMPDTSSFQLPPRSREISRGNTVFHWTDEQGEFHEADATAITFESWAAEVTRIEWRNTPLLLAADEIIATPGEWQVFSETVPNLEVRIGAILALERLARQNLDVHVQIMEILTAYIRENAKAEDAPKLPAPPEYKPEDHEGWKKAFDLWKKEHDAALTDIRPREDIQKALSVIGRRSAKQRAEEARWQNPDPDARFVFDDPPPPYPHMPGATHDRASHKDWAKRHAEWRTRLKAYRGYRIDLRRTNLAGADLAGVHFSGARLSQAQIQGTRLIGAQIQGVRLSEARMQGASLNGAQMQGASLDGAQMQRTLLDGAQMQGASLYGAQLQGARLGGARLDWALNNETPSLSALFSGAQMQEARLFRAQMQGAQLDMAKLQGAGFSLVQMQGVIIDSAALQGTDFGGSLIERARIANLELDNTTSFAKASLRYSALINVDFRPTPNLLSTIAGALPTLFADGSVQLPTNHSRPPHWREWVMNPATFEACYDKWVESFEKLAR